MSYTILNLPKINVGNTSFLQPKRINNNIIVKLKYKLEDELIPMLIQLPYLRLSANNLSLNDYVQFVLLSENEQKTAMTIQMLTSIDSAITKFLSQNLGDIKREYNVNPTIKAKYQTIVKQHPDTNNYYINLARPTNNPLLVFDSSRTPLVEKGELDSLKINKMFFRSIIEISKLVFNCDTGDVTVDMFVHQIEANVPCDVVELNNYSFVPEEERLPIPKQSPQPFQLQPPPLVKEEKKKVLKIENPENITNIQKSIDTLVKSSSREEPEDENKDDDETSDDNLSELGLKASDLADDDDEDEDSPIPKPTIKQAQKIKPKKK